MYYRIQTASFLTLMNYSILNVINCPLHVAGELMNACTFKSKTSIRKLLHGSLSLYLISEQYNTTRSTKDLRPGFIHSVIYCPLVVTVR